MLVLGDEAQENGLAVSLLERLQKRYEMMGEVAKPYCATLVTNYRCHEKIVELAEKLFYKTPLKCNVSSNSTHPDAPFPLRFICSSVDDKMKHVRNAKYGKEAEFALWEAANLAKKWPVDGWGPKNLSEICFMSSARSQVSLVLGVMTLLMHSAQKSYAITLSDNPGCHFDQLEAIPNAAQVGRVTEISYICYSRYIYAYTSIRTNLYKICMQATNSGHSS